MAVDSLKLAMDTLDRGGSRRIQGQARWHVAWTSRGTMRRANPSSISLFFLVVVSALTRSGPTRAAPPLTTGTDALEDARLDGELDAEDLAAMPMPRLGAHVTGDEVHGQTWVSLVGFTKSLPSGRSDLGAMLVVGVALDRIAAGTGRARVPDAHDDSAGSGAATTSSTATGTEVPAPSSHPTIEASPPLAAPGLARRCVAAALRTSGLGVDDARLDALVSRARASAWLPEARVRAMRLWADANHQTTTVTTDTTSLYDSVGANLVVEMRLTWRFDRLLYAGDEPSVERVRLDREEARARVAQHVLEVLFAWQRARLDEASAVAGSRELAEARLRVAETSATLDVLTGGWFSVRDPPPASSAP